jgi:hypothetical protein
MRLFVFAPGQNAEANQTNSDDREAKQTPEFFGERDLTKTRFFGKRDLGGLRLRWDGLGRLSLGWGFGDQAQGRPSPEWSRTGSRQQGELSWTQIETRMRDSITTSDC